MCVRSSYPVAEPPERVAPVSPSAERRREVVKLRRWVGLRGEARASLVMEVRSIFDGGRGFCIE